jgi:hypothetical protein
MFDWMSATFLDPLGQAGACATGGDTDGDGIGDLLLGHPSFAGGEGQATVFVWGLRILAEPDTPVR